MPTIEDVQKTVEVPLTQCMQKTVEEPQIQYIDKIEDIIDTKIITAYKNYMAPGMAQIATSVVKGAVPLILQMFDDADLTLVNVINGFEAKMNEVDETLEKFMSIICHVKAKNRATNDKLETVEHMVEDMVHELWDS